MGRPRGRFIALEGVDGCGKSTQARLLATSLGAELTHEPGATDLGRALRALALDGSSALDPRAEALLMIADRAQHVAEVVEPALAAGRWVVSDRYSASTVAYQGYGRGLNVAELERLSDWAASGLIPDLYILVEVSFERALSRRGRREGRATTSGRSADRMESEAGEFHAAVAHGFAAQAAADPDRWVVIDGNPPVARVAETVLSAVTERIGLP